jgi:hypothetical protein
MSRTINALSRGELQKGLQAVTKDVETLTRNISGADSEPVVAAAGVLLKEVKRLISTPGGGKPAPPGSPPRKQSGQLYRSWKSRVVQGVRRVGSGLFTASLAEYGTPTEPPRPYARAALENVQTQMTDVLVTESQKKIAEAP